MKRIWPVLFLVLVGFLLISATTAQEKASQSAPPGPTVVSQAKFPVALKDGDYVLETVVLDFAEGSVVPNHKHGGYVLVTVLSGEITLKEESGEKLVKAGESWTEAPGQVHSVVNKGKAVARVVGSFLLPKGAEETTIIKE